MELQGIGGYTLDGKPFIRVMPPRYLEPGDEVRDIVLRFKNPSRVAFTFGISVRNGMSEAQFGVRLLGDITSSTDITKKEDGTGELQPFPHRF